MEVPPVFDLAVSRWTGATREIGYAIVGGLEKFKYRLPMFLEQPVNPERPGAARRIVRWLRLSLAIRFLLPAWRNSSPSELVSSAWYELPSPGFEASRRVFEFQDGEANVGQLICHVFAEQQGEAADRLLSKFAVIVGRGVQPSSGMYDAESRLCLHGRLSARLRGRQYWEIIIGSWERFPPEPAPVGVSADASGGQFVQGGLTLGSVSEYDTPDAEALGVEMPDAEFLQGVAERSEVDWKFVMSEIHVRVNKGESLDESFIQALAERRLAHAKRELPMEEPGPTLDSSLEIVRDIVALYEMAALDNDLEDGG